MLDRTAPGFQRYRDAAGVALLVERIGAQHQVPLPVLMGVIAQESAFDQRAFRAEPAIRDASRGYMQILYRTARAVGYTGDPVGLFDATVNIEMGTRYLADCIRAHHGDVWAGVSQYNNGNGKRTTRDVTVCDARDARGACIQSHLARTGEFFNQPYVTAVQRKAALFPVQSQGSGMPSPDASHAMAWLAAGLYAVWLGRSL